MAENMMNSYFKATNDVARKNHNKTFTFTKRNKERVDRYLEEWERKEDIENLYNMSDIIERYFGYNTRVVLDVDTENDVLLAIVQIPKKKYMTDEDGQYVYNCLEVLNTDFDKLVVWIKEII